MRALSLAIVLSLPSPLAALAHPMPEGATGLYGSASDPATSCAANPHELGFIANPPHVVLTWDLPKEGPLGGMRQQEVYDLERFGDTSIFLREEAPYRSSEGGTWQLQITQNPDGYCWRRPDWPVVRCEDQQLRCESATS